MLKERFKSLNMVFEKIHKTQNAWVVYNEQLRVDMESKDPQSTHDKLRDTSLHMRVLA
ncbi:hypothetical protein JHK87_055377 [Glycine soja]|nr:hypothetical protein JHK87_055377 [Glycine soja]